MTFSFRTAPAALACLQILLSTCPVYCTGGSHQAAYAAADVGFASGHEHHHGAAAGGQVSPAPAMSADPQGCCGDCASQLTSVQPKTSHDRVPAPGRSELIVDASNDVRATLIGRIHRDPPNISPPGLLNSPLRI